MHCPNLAPSVHRYAVEPSFDPGLVLSQTAGRLARIPPGDDGPKGCGQCQDDPTGDCPHGRQFCVLPGFEGFRCCPTPPPPPAVCGPCECERTCTRPDGTTFTRSCRPEGGCCRVG
jgi:hypothetical protein